MTGRPLVTRYENNCVYQHSSIRTRQGEVRCSSNRIICWLIIPVIALEQPSLIMIFTTLISDNCAALPAQSRSLSANRRACFVEEYQNEAVSVLAVEHNLNFAKKVGTVLTS